MSEKLNRRHSRSSAWKKYQKSSQSSKRTKLALFALAFLVAVVVVGKLIGLIGSLVSPVTGGEVISGQKSYHWDGKSTINLVVKTDTVYTVSYNPSDEEIVILKIPDDTYLNVPNGFGRWPTRSVYGLGQSDNRTSGPRLLNQTLQLNLGVPIDGYISLSGSYEQQPLEEVIESIKNNPFSTLNVFKHTSTDLNSVELGRLFWSWWGVRKDKVKTVDLGQSKITRSILLQDGSRALGIDQLLLDQLIQSQFEDTRLSYEGLNIAVFNSTSHPGLAEKASRIITNMGGRVIFTANSSVKLDHSEVVGSKSYSKTRLSQVFASQCLKNECKVTDPNLDTSRADISVILGEDLQKKIGDSL